jgi:hypothetical protein
VGSFRFGVLLLLHDRFAQPEKKVNCLSGWGRWWKKERKKE